MIAAELARPTERELALSAHHRHRAFHRAIEDKAAARIAPKICPPASWEEAAPPAVPEPDIPVDGYALPKDWFRDAWFFIEGVSPNKKLTLMQIKMAVCRHYGVQHSDVISGRRTKEIMPARQTAMYLCKELTPSTLPAIGRAFGNRDHTTILHAVRKIARLIALPDDADLVAAVTKIRADLEGSL